MGDVMTSMWTPGMVDAVFLSVLLLVGHVLKRRVAVLRRLLLPSSIIAGFLGLVLGRSVLGVIPLNEEFLGTMVYHLLAIGFIALALKDRPVTPSRPVVKTGLFIVAIYLIQGILGLVMSMILAATLFPQMFPAIGLLLPLGFGQGPGQSYSIGRSWETAGVAFGGSIGLTIATIGFLWAVFGGVLLANMLGRRAGKSAQLTAGAASTATTTTGTTGTTGAAGARAAESDLREEIGELPLSNMIDGGTLQLFLIGMIYLAVYGTLIGLSALLHRIGPVGANLANTLWGFHFIFGTLYAVVTKLVMNALKRRGLMRNQYNNNYLLSRISGTAFDFMVTASIAAISVQVFVDNWVAILSITTVGGLVTAWFSYFVAKRVFGVDILEYTLGFFGTYTGTLSTGMALLRTVDADFRTGVADHIVLGSGLALFLAFPLLVILNIPIIGFTSAQPAYYWYTLAALVAYAAIILVLLFRRPQPRVPSSQ